MGKRELSCPLPVDDVERVSLAAGGGGRAMRRLLADHVARALPAAVDHDGATLELGGGRYAFTADASVVRPSEFPGGDLGYLAVCGAVNDLAMCGAQPVALSLCLILEEGLPVDHLDRILAGVARASAEIGVPVVTGDTKVVERGQCDQIYAAVSGVGRIPEGIDIHPRRVTPGDAILLSGDIGRHGVALFSVREGIGFDVEVRSDVAPVHRAVAALLAAAPTHALRDPTRGGLAAVLTEIAQSCGHTFTLDEARIPLHPGVRAASELLGLDPLHLPNEGRFVAFVPGESAPAALAALRAAGCPDAAQIGRVEPGGGEVHLRTVFGGVRVVDLPEGELLPRIC